MKKKRAVLLFGSLLLMLAGYVAWCARPMYLSVPVPELLEIPAKYREDARAFVVEQGLTGPDSCSVGALAELLIRPYDSAPLPVSLRVQKDAAGDYIYLYVSRLRWGHHPNQPHVEFNLEKRRWAPKNDTWKAWAMGTANGIPIGRELKEK